IQEEFLRKSLFRRIDHETVLGGCCPKSIKPMGPAVLMVARSSAKARHACLRAYLHRRGYKLQRRGIQRRFRSSVLKPRPDSHVVTVLVSALITSFVWTRSVVS